MTNLRKVELLSGILTGVLALVVSCTLAPPRSILEFLELLPFYVGPALLVTVGSYFHAVRLKIRGLVTLLVGASILTLMIFGLIFSGVFYFYGLWGGLLTLTPSATAIVTLIASFLTKRSDKKVQDALSKPRS